jgi:hypothetical protein
MMAYGTVTKVIRKKNRRMARVVSKLHKNVQEASVATVYMLQANAHILAD